MRCRIEFYYFLIIALVLPKIVCGWGYDAHQRINWSAANIIPGKFGKYVHSNRQELAQYAVVADYIKSSDNKEAPRHYIDADLYDVFPFDSLLGSLADLEAKYGKDMIGKWGYGPWAIDETCNRVIYMLKNKRWDEAIFHTQSLLSTRAVSYVSFHHTFRVEYLLENGNLISISYRPGYGEFYE
jgi:hypothetical protein